MSRSDVTLEDLYLYEIGYYRNEKGEIEKMSHKKIEIKASKALKKDADRYKEKAAHAKTPIKAKHERIEEKEARAASRDLKKRARKAHEY